ncbi:hypothetical protein EMPS_05906 [Entomortierella parvispora]|uniref:Uncharacterized protein n=1 Tax=Entomortierella parvispora TaxID=205924 RepID=A0A9P3HBV9_9FUNG|nr:hypothetical protein EMPS_05906 [Entomortierella parvispora]
MSSSSTKAQAQHQQQQQLRDNQRRQFASSPPSPIHLNRALSAFYSAPSFEDVKKKSLTLLPSPTTMQTMNLDIKELPSEPSSSRNSVSSNPSSPYPTPAVALTMASPVQAGPKKSARAFGAEDESDSIMDQDNPQPFRVNASDIPRKQPSPANDLSEIQQRGMDKIKRLSNDALNVSREGSPVPRGRLSEDMSSREAANSRSKIDELQLQIKQLRDNMLQNLNTEDDVAQMKNSRDKYQQENVLLHQKLETQQRDYEVMSKNYFDLVRLIRVTDDDHSTIIDKLNKLKTSIENLVKKAQGGRSVNLNKDAALEHIKNSGKLEGFPVPEDKLDAHHLNLFMESIVMSTLVSFFFEKPLSSIFDYNDGFKQIYDWMRERNPTLAFRWRQQLCVMLRDDPKTKVRQEELVASAVAVLSEIVSSVYTNTEESVKIRDICNQALALSLALTSQESAIFPETVPIGTDFDAITMIATPKSNIEGKVVLVVFPTFKDEAMNAVKNEAKDEAKDNAKDDTRDDANDDAKDDVKGFSVRSKVWCY